MSAQRFYFETAGGGGSGGAFNSTIGVSTGDVPFFITLQGAYSFTSVSNAVFISPGILGYPSRSLQFALSPGIGIVNHNSSSDTDTSFSLVASAALDIGKRNGFLIGYRYLGSWGDREFNAHGPFVGYRFSRTHRGTQDIDRTANNNAQNRTTQNNLTGRQLRLSNAISRAVGSALSDTPQNARIHINDIIHRSSFMENRVTPIVENAIQDMNYSIVEGREASHTMIVVIGNSTVSVQLIDNNTGMAGTMVSERY